MEETCQHILERDKLDKESKKRARKQMRAAHTVLRHAGISTVSHATQSLVIANGGLGNGVSRERLLDMLKGFGSVLSLLMPPNKPYAFVRYDSFEDAKMAFLTLNGCKLQAEGQPVTLYVNFVDKVDFKEHSTQSLPPGLLVVEDFVSLEYEQELLQLMALNTATQGTKTAPKKSLKHRKVKHYGYEFCYDNNNVDLNAPLPGGLPIICDDVIDECMKIGYLKSKPDQLTINQYEPGQGIPPHIDTHSAFEDVIISLSLGAKIVMDFKHPDGQNVSVLLPQRSLLVMKGESRYLWSHGITPRKSDVVPVINADAAQIVSSDLGNLTLNKRETRTSFTFRKVRQTPCNCVYPSVCDSQSAGKLNVPPSVPQSEVDASCLEQDFVHKVYEEIAGHFSSTRHSPWPKVVEFLKSLSSGALVVDIGCGNGKYLGVNKDLYMIGCDRSRNLVEICRERQFQAFVSDALSIPIRDGICDACISIAVIHHFSTKGRRLAAIKELMRILKPGGKALIYVWALEQEYNNKKSKYLKENKAQLSQIDMKEAKHYELTSITCTHNMEDTSEDTAEEPFQAELTVHTNRTSFLSKDLLVPWHLKGISKNSRETDKPRVESDIEPQNSAVFHRYYHVFSKGELEELCTKIECVQILSSYYDQGNWCVIIGKLL
ncbi:alkylated DNA repair protein alkB homolog 8 [Erpetoichthys calabaricus]|uniref:alkylated DNA repair protein alkB homolog 8 n=1 Tax=Erpetoichthys calabaricus TaxID=27687 RepID=UPI0022340289|nr:alkylated DNA repair protein alkB homolog 8 [Erpetoichthys calabaricus]